MKQHAIAFANYINKKYHTELGDDEYVWLEQEYRVFIKQLKT